jgi:ribosomal protein S18 acetylase RimI-like enzyme
MNKLKIRPMTEPEYLAWREYSGKNYAAEKEKEGLSPEDARAESEKSFARHLPQGRDTPNYYLYTVVAAGSEEQVGILWWGVQKQGSKSVAWIYDIEMQPAHRGKGYGRATMELAQADAKAKGYDRLGLHVFGHNKAARSLYESLGFEATNVVMYKDLT